MSDTLPWPLHTIDFEASSLDDGTYPIEVGICRWTAPTAAIEGWSTLIAPTPHWREHGSWWPASQEVHGIGRDELAEGMAPTEVVHTLNAITRAHPVFCDGGAHDVHWLRMLADASGVRPAFPIGDFDHLAVELDQTGYMRMVHWLDRAPTRHRARDDAERLMKAIARGLGADHGTSRDIAPPMPAAAV